MPKIYGVFDHEIKSTFSHGSNCFGFIIAEDGTILGSNISSSESWLRDDLGMVTRRGRSSRQKDFEKHYPDGFETEYVSKRDRHTHVGLKAACARAVALNKADPVSASGS